MSFIIAEECSNLGLRAGAVLFRNVHVEHANSALRCEIAEEVRAIQARFADAGALRSAPEVIGFREILRKVGINPRKQQPSVERLLSFALKRGDLPAVNNLVDAYNLISIRSLCSLGAHDFDTVAAPVSLRLLSGEESFNPLGRNAETAIAAGEYGYVDARNRVLCRLDILQADFSKVTERTVNALLIVEGTTAHPAQVLPRALANAVDVVTRYCGGSAEVIRSPLSSSAS